jgi:micrococcal nuclease
MELTLYHYKAKVESIYDGDTVRVNIDLGLKTWNMDEPIRLLGITAPELRGKSRFSRYLGNIWIEENGK